MMRTRFCFCIIYTRFCTRICICILEPNKLRTYNSVDSQHGSYASHVTPSRMIYIGYVQHVIFSAFGDGSGGLLPDMPTCIATPQYRWGDDEDKNWKHYLELQLRIVIWNCSAHALYYFLLEIEIEA